MIRVILADDHGIIRQGLRSLLEKEPDIEVVAEAEDGQQALCLVKAHTPAIVIMDITMPNLNGIEATRHMKEHFPETRVIALSIHSNRRFVGDMIRAGACGYVLKECLFDELVQAIRVVHDGGHYLSPRITGVIVDEYVQKRQQQNQSRLASLTAREKEVLQLLAEGNTTKQIAMQLHVTPKAIEANRRKIMDKLDIYSVAELTKYAVKEGLTSLDI